MKNCIRIHESDNVATVLAHVDQEDELTILNAHMDKVGSIRAIESIPFAHKIALREIGNRENVTKYGERIGRATRSIPQGGYVHVHNVVSVEGAPAAQIIDRLVEL